MHYGADGGHNKVPAGEGIEGSHKQTHNQPADFGADKGLNGSSL